MTNELVLENYGVQELRAVEKVDVDGGNMLGPRWNGSANFAFAVMHEVSEFFGGFGEAAEDCKCNIF